LVFLLVAGLAALPAADDPPQFSDWSAPVNLGPIVNSPATEAGAFISKDGLSLYFGAWSCGPTPSPPCRPDGFGQFDIYVSQRATAEEPWGPPQNLGPTINTSSNEQTPTLSLDGHRLYFASDRPGGFGNLDLYVSRRHNRRDDFGWQPPVNLGSGVNTSTVERSPAPFEDDVTETLTLYFSSNRPAGMAGENIYASTLQPDETFGPAALVPELSSPSADSVPAIRRDGLEMFLCSNRPGTVGGQDLWVATRPSTWDLWSAPVNLGSVVNSTVLDFRPALSFDGTALYFHSERPGGFGGYDLYVTTRTKLKEPD
jgi:Tol biopolymer transport system component